MKKKDVRLCAIGALGLVFLANGTLMAAEPVKDTTTVANTGTTYQWHDGERVIRTVMSSELIAEFLPAGVQSAVSSAYPSAASVGTNSGGVKIWKVSGVKDINVAIQSVHTLNPASRISPVFYSSPAGGAKMALPGNVIVEFKPSMSESQIGEWLKQNGYKVIKTIALENTNLYVLKTGSGLESLDTANKIYQSGVAKRSQPNWWNEFVPK